MHRSIRLAVYFSLVLATTSLAEDNSQPSVESEVDRLLKKLDEQQAARLSGQDEWAETMRELIQLGPDAVPALSQALVDTPHENRRMLRSLPFILRGIGDPRAIPALIQTLPKCCARDGSDMGYNTEDPELLAFMRKHDNDLENRDPVGYNWGRPINEVRTALNKLSGVEHGEIELCHVHGQAGTPLQQYLKQELFHRVAGRWEAWWEDHWSNYVADERFAKVKLPTLEGDASAFELDRSANLTVGARMSNMIAEPFTTDGGKRVFYDIDTGRWGGLHKKWKQVASAETEEIIAKWAVSEGYDLMGTQIEEDGKPMFVLRALSAEVWRIPDKHWNAFQTVSAEELIAQGSALDEILTLSRQGVGDSDESGIFFVMTRTGSAALIRVGVEVYDTNVVIGQPVVGDRELLPVGFRKGRRFALRLLQP